MYWIRIWSLNFVGLAELESDSSVKGAVLISSKETGFIVGADLDMLEIQLSRKEQR